MVRFIHTTPDKPGPWRRQARQACPACRSRKKRCKHLVNNRPGSAAALLEEASSEPLSPAGETAPLTASSISGNDGYTSSRSGAPSHALPRALPTDERATPPRDDAQHPNTEPSQSSDAHFVGDLNPESTFLADSPETAGGYAEADGIGVWVSRRAAARGAPSGPRVCGPGVSTLAVGNMPENCLEIIPADVHYKRLEEIYLRDIHKILPVIDLDVLRNGTATISHVISKQAVSLAAAAHPDAKPYLTLGPSTKLLHYPAFSQQLISAMRTILNTGLENDRLQLTPPLVILSLNTYSSPDRHLPAELASLAVSYTQTVGLHHRSPPASHNPEYLERLFCCVWAMDRLNAAFHGRPVLMHERDFGRDLGGCFGRQESCCRLFLECVMLLDGVIQLYRPTADSGGGGWELPRFEELVEKAEAFGVESRLLVTIELLYHAIVILSCRAPLASRSPAHVTPGESLSSLAITTIVAEFRDRLPRLTFVSYAASLALRTTYRELRASSVSTVRARSFKQLRDNCRMLREFEEMYRPASFMVGLVDRLTREIDRASGNPVRSADEPARTPSVPLHNDRAPRGGEGDVPADDATGVQEARVSPPLDPEFFDGLARLDAFGSLDFDFDFDTLDAVFGDGTYPCRPDTLYDT